MALCNTPVIGNRRTFWTTQPCETRQDVCDNDCAVYGLELYCPNVPNCTDHTVDAERSIKTNDWVRSLIVNILMTNGRRADIACGWRPGQRGGHWSDSYRSGGYNGTAGSNIRNLTSHGRVADAIKELKAIVTYDLQKLVTYGVATSIEVDVTYKGSNAAQLDIVVYGVGGSTSRVGLSANREKNSWVWST